MITESCGVCIEDGVVVFVCLLVVVFVFCLYGDVVVVFVCFFAILGDCLLVFVLFLTRTVSAILYIHVFIAACNASDFGFSCAGVGQFVCYKLTAILTPANRGGGGRERGGEEREEREGGRERGEGGGERGGGGRERGEREGREREPVTWQLSENTSVASYGSSWRKDVVNRRSVTPLSDSLLLFAPSFFVSFSFVFTLSPFYPKNWKFLSQKLKRKNKLFSSSDDY